MTAEEIEVLGDTPGWDTMIERTGGRTTPQILIDEEVIGGYDELATLNATGVLDEKLGLAKRVDLKTLYDVIIIGAGPAGMTAAVYASRKGLKCLVLGKDVGGQLNITAELENYLGFHYIEAQSLIDKFDEHVKQFEMDRIIGENVVRLEALPKIKRVCTQTGHKYQGRSLIIASGKRPRCIGVPGEERLMGKGVAFCATCDAPFYKGLDVAVVGGGNSAIEAALELDRMAKKVYLVALGDYTGDDVLVNKLRQTKRMEQLTGHETLEILGKDEVEGIRVRSKSSGEEKTLSVRGVFVEVGLLPNSGFALDVLQTNPIGEILIDCDTNTGVPGVFAAGDVTSVRDKQVLVAAGEGAKAALRAAEYLVTQR